MKIACQTTAMIILVFAWLSPVVINSSLYFKCLSEECLYIEYFSNERQNNSQTVFLYKNYFYGIFNQNQTGTNHLNSKECVGLIFNRICEMCEGNCGKEDETIE